MKWQIFLIILLIIPCVNAEVKINKVLYNPIKTESGGEAIEIINQGEQIINIENWTIKTPSSETDAVLPDETLMPGQAFLITDEGWNKSKDNPDWRNADYEEKITLKNTNGGVALKNNKGIPVDSISWGAENFGKKVKGVKEGKCLVREEETFIEEECDFFKENIVKIQAKIEEEFKAWLTSLKIKPGKKIIVRANKPGNITFRNKTIQLTEKNNTYYAEINTTGLLAGTYKIYAGNEVLNFTVLEFSYIRIKQKKLNLDPEDFLELENLGNTITTITIKANNLQNKNKTISKKYLLINEQSLEEDAEFELKPRETKKLRLRIDNKLGLASGTYTTELRITYDS